MIFKAKAKDGRLLVADKTMFSDYLRELEGKDIIVAVEGLREDRRTVYQNRLYFGFIGKAVSVLNERGYTMNKLQLHNYYKSLFLAQPIIDPKTNEEISIVISSTSLDKDQFSEYFEKVMAYTLQDLHIDPDDLEPYVSGLKSFQQ